MKNTLKKSSNEKEGKDLDRNVKVLKRKSIDDFDSSKFGSNPVNSKSYKMRSLAVDLVKYFKDREKEFDKDNNGEAIMSITQNELLESMIKLGYSRSYVYMRLKIYSSSVNKIIDGSKSFDTLEPLLIKRNRSFYDGNAGWIYSLNDCWRGVSDSDIEYAFNGV